MDGVYPTSYCFKQPYNCNGSYTGGTWVSSGYIRNNGQTSFVTEQYDEGFQNYFTNNPPPAQLYVRVAPSQYPPFKPVYWINGWERPRLVLKKGKKYQINVNACGNPFYLTTDSKGGQGNNGNVTSVIPSDYYVTTYTMNNNMPQKFYYQCSKVSGMGGEVIIT
jgi:hypothetical protein